MNVNVGPDNNPQVYEDAQYLRLMLENPASNRLERVFNQDSLDRKEAEISVIEREKRIQAARPVPLWASTELTKAVNDNIYTQDYISSQAYDRKVSIAIEYCVKKEWYFDWPVEIRQHTANIFKDFWKLTREAMYRKLLDNNTEPWQSINAYVGYQSVPIDPHSGDMRVNYLYDEEYPWAGYLIQYWFPEYGNNPDRYGIIRVNDFKTRISHLSPNVNIALKNAGDKFDNDVAEAKKYAIGGGIIVLGIGTAVAAAQLINAYGSLQK